MHRAGHVLEVADALVDGERPTQSCLQQQREIGRSARSEARGSLVQVREAYREHAGRRTFSRSSLKSAEGVSGTGASVFGGREDAADAAPLDEDAPDAV